ncbi:L,D-transpeptidase family protein [Motilimonas pumila]|uniref:L,D-TPase catalytic domain-containing protein n=1 Tax=Motilimonas pumila TaxID=2303987 RepID=A0A418YD11_9GAMM|nr:L,D-transpeptidase family protein [Motilimonas pumila]RJG42402.1 hypothetical protein D1Z90_13085 [Motilimonas pumila]
MKPAVSAFLYAALCSQPALALSDEFAFPDVWNKHSDPSSMGIYHQNYQALMLTSTWHNRANLQAAIDQIEVAGQARVDATLTGHWQQLQANQYAVDTQRQRQALAEALLATYSYKDTLQTVGVDWFFKLQPHQRPDVMAIPSRDRLVAMNEALELQNLADFTQQQQKHPQQFMQMLNAKRHLSYIRYDIWPLVEEPKKVVRANDSVASMENILNIMVVLGDITQQEADEIMLNSESRLTKAFQSHIKTFQIRHGLYPDGVIGPKTMAWLNTDPQQRMQQLALNMLRLELWPEDKQGLIEVNIPGYEMDVWVKGEKVFETKVIVGKPTRQTPVFTTRLDSVIFNPGWNIPSKIMRKDILPKARVDTTYTYRKGYEVVSSWSRNAKVIPNADIHWPSVNPKTFPYRMRQPPGNANALGRYKFNTPNDQAIYLHDTPGKRLFNKDIRAFSSGCIRVKDANVFANKLLTLSNKDPKNYEQYQQYDTNIFTKYVPLRLKLPVHTTYRTAWVNEGKLAQFREDIYKFDRATVDHNIAQINTKKTD